MRREFLLLREMRDAALAIQELVAGRSAEEIETDDMRRSALLWHFTVLGEAASQVPPETKSAEPALAWRAATRMRNRIVHGYWDLDVETLVATACYDLPRMIVQLEHLIADLDQDADASSSAPEGG